MRLTIFRGQLEKPSRAARVQGGRNAATGTYQVDRRGSEYRPRQQSGRAVGFSRRPRALPALAWLLPGSAWAHSPIVGINNFYNGLLHPIFVPSHLMLVIALGLFLGQRGMEQAKPALFTYLGAVLAGLCLAWFTPALPSEELVLVIAVVCGLLVAIAPKPPLYAYAALAAVAGFSLGLDSAQETLFGRERFAALFGSGVALYFLSLYPIALSEHLQRVAWQSIGVRVLGSWVAASSLLVLTLSLAPEAVQGQ